MVTGSDDNNVRIFNTENCQLIHQVTEHTGRLYIYSNTHKCWIHVIFCYNSSLCWPFCLIFGQ